MMTDKERLDGFVKELNELTKKYRVSIYDSWGNPACLTPFDEASGEMNCEYHLGNSLTDEQGDVYTELMRG
jgi:hypothetical protein